MLVVIGMGIPGVGKSTRLKQLAQAFNATYICPDDHVLRAVAEDFGSEANAIVWDDAYFKLEEALLLGQDVVFDATNVSFHKRRTLLSRCKNHTPHVYGMLFYAPFDECVRRNNLRKRKVPVEAMRVKARSLTSHPPSTEEGFEKIWYVKCHQNSCL